MKKKVLFGLVALFIIPLSAFVLLDEKNSYEFENKPIVDVTYLINHEVDIDSEEVEEILPLDEISVIYEDAFNTVVDGYNLKLEKIIDEASREYEELPYEDRRKTSVKARLITKYISEIGELEKNIDNVFYYYLDNLKDQLSKGGYGQEIADEYLDRYIDEKELLHHKFLNDTINMDGVESDEVD
ncbi:MAG: hypothetical protein U9Q80_01965 [Bacillota bacterium]|nr:hypothetical protein [Bacillota bacterium]